MRYVLALTVALLAGLIFWFTKGPDETISGYAAPGATWGLTALNGTPFDGQADLSFPEQGQIAGLAPCGAFTARQAAPYPWFELAAGSLSAPGCDSPANDPVLAALSRMEIAEVSGPVLILSTEAGAQMLFHAR